jgi:phenylalanyl-tRNA synthetase beta chain
MKFAFAMLLDFVDTAKSAEEVGELLTMAGFELEGIEQVEGEMMLDIKVVSNRGDGLSVLGLAREVLAKDADAKPTKLYERARARFPMPDENETSASRMASVKIDAEECDRFSARVFEGDFNRPSAEWMQKRLRISGVRAISLLVDLSNYVMLEVGQPLHAFDRDKLAGSQIIVRQAKSGEKLTTLNGEEHELKGQMMVCDLDKPVGVPGVMGGLDSEVTEKTTHLLVESAHFLNTAVRKTRKQLGLSTEASYRFERSVDPEGTVAALNRFAELLAEADGGESLVKGVIDVYPNPPARPAIPFRITRACELLGMPISADEARGYLERLGFEIEGIGEEFVVKPPTWRPDIVQEYDVVEEIGRVHGFDRIPETPIVGTTTQGGVFGLDKFVESLRNRAVGLGFIQNVSSSLMDLHPLDDSGGVRLGPRHPSSPEMALLRNSLWPNLSDNARRNGGANLRLFEIGSVFGVTGKYSEVRKMAMLSSGGVPMEHWEKLPTAPPTFFTLKEAVEELTGRRVWSASSDPRLHPTRQASSVGALIGQIHPDIAERMDLPATTFLAEFGIETAFGARGETLRSKPISRNPAVRRDIAVLIDRAVPYASLQHEIDQACGDLLEKQWLFDVYAGKGIPEGKHSLTIALQIRKMGENLTDEEANQVRDRAVAALAKLGATQR